MGNISSSKVDIVPEVNETELFHAEGDSDDYPLEIQIAHYTPASFPLTPVVTKSTIAVCRESWQYVLKPIQKEDGTVMSGLTAFYTEFYDNLDMIDTNEKFESILRQHAGGLETRVAKGAILIRIMTYALNLEPESEKCRFALYTLGKSHNHKSIRPWQYAVLIQTLLTTLSSRLQNEATHEVMAAWVNLFAFMLRNILPAAIRGLVDNAEAHINVSKEVGNEATTDEIVEADQVRELKKIEKKMRSRHGSSANSHVPSGRSSASNSRRAW